MASNVRQQLSQLASLSHSGGSHKEVTEKYINTDYSAIQVSISGIDLGRAFAILALIFRKWRREKTLWGHFGA